MRGPEIHVAPPERYAELAAERIARAMRASIEERGACRIGLAGGRTPAPIYRELARRRDIAWGAVDVFFGDERIVPPDDEASNYRMARQTLLDALPEPPRGVHRIETEHAPSAAARAYAETLGDAPLDVLLLGMGTDGHTASIFPGTEDPTGGGARVIVTHSPSPPHPRISLSLATINEARSVFLLVAGSRKAARLAQVRSQVGRRSATLPAARVRPAEGRLYWLVDRAAAGGIQSTRGTR